MLLNLAAHFTMTKVPAPTDTFNVNFELGSGHDGVSGEIGAGENVRGEAGHNPVISPASGSALSLEGGNETAEGDFQVIVLIDRQIDRQSSCSARYT